MSDIVVGSEGVMVKDTDKTSLLLYNLVWETENM